MTNINCPYSNKDLDASTRGQYHQDYTLHCAMCNSIGACNSCNSAAPCVTAWITCVSVKISATAIYMAASYPPTEFYHAIP